MQRCQETKSDVLTDPALVLLRNPVEFKWTNGLEGGEDGVEDLEVDVMAKVAPDAHEDEEVGTNYGRVDIVEELGGL